MAPRSSAPATSSRSAPGRGPRVLLIGHLDTVFEPDSPFQRFERVDDKTARGPGIIDMKGGDVVMISALKALKAAGALDAPAAARRPDRRRGAHRRAAVGGARGARLRGEEGRHRHRLRERTRRSAHRRDRPARDDRVAAAGEGEAGAFVADLSRGHRLGRDLRGGADPPGVPRDARRRGASHLQSRA